MQRDDLIAETRAWLQLHPRAPGDSLLAGRPLVPPIPLPPRDLAFGTNELGRHPHEDKPQGDERPAAEPPTWKAPRPTHHAGFLFLVPLLTHVGIARLLAKNPGLTERDWMAALLLRFARRLGVPRADPAMAWIAAHPVGVARADRTLTAEVMYAARVHLRIEAGLTLRELVSRSGAVVAPRGHVDVLLHPADVDAGVHRAGLDGDPGWTPWLGRIVQFHYRDAVDVTA